ncbi:MAG: Asp-tRNA(Asn)/Glu-tRNA(Gln) amidotransferase subunit GatC [Alphaproteobacteria bacterium]|nr:Asp-tRNA(Asn)/Glu-tRNA(Gln) amidotransferase subunit GatC [Alphaproteobacteria bacterium]
MPLDKDTVRKIATLARIKVEEDALEPLAGELNNILGWVEQLDEVDTEEVAPMTSVVAADLFQRPDNVSDGDRVEAILANAPEETQHFFVVPKVIE